MRAPIFVSLMLVAMPWLTVPVQAQEEPEKPKGVFGLLGKLTNPTGSAFIYKDVAGKEWKTKNFRHISAEEGKKFQEALDAKNGFRHYTFGMTIEEFLKIAKPDGRRWVPPGRRRAPLPIAGLWASPVR